jgi:hypothetical protein
VGRAWPRHRHRGRPLNSVVRCHSRATVPEFIKDHLAAMFVILGSVVGVLGIIAIQAGPATLEYFVAGVVLCCLGGACFFAASKISPSVVRGVGQAEQQARGEE